MGEEQKKYIEMLRDEYYNNEWEDCINCHVACVRPQYKDLKIAFSVGRKFMSYKYKDEKTVKI